MPWFAGSSDARRFRRPLARCSLFAVSLLLQAIPARTATLKRIAVIDLPAPPGQHFDHLAIDYDDHYLLSAHLGPGILYVIDTRSNKLVKAIQGLSGITAPVYVPRLRKVYTCDWGENKIGIISLSAMQVTKKLPTRQKPNGGAYAEPFGKVYISDTLGKEVAVVDVHTDTIVKEVKFHSETGMVQFDPVGRKVLVNLRTTNKIAEIDPASDAVVGEYPVGRCDFNQGMALDAGRRRAFLLCTGNNLLAVFDMSAHRCIAYLPLPPGADDVQFDPGLRRIYVACESGAISVVHEVDANHFVKLEDFQVPAGVHTLAVDAETHRVYAPEQEENTHPVSRMIVFAAVQNGMKP